MGRLWDGTDSQAVLVRFPTKLSEVSHGRRGDFPLCMLSPKIALESECMRVSLGDFYPNRYNFTEPPSISVIATAFRSAN